MDTKETSLFQGTKNYQKLVLVILFSIIIYIIAAFNNSEFITIMPSENYLTWHTFMEFASILVSFSIFTVTYFIYEESGNLQMIIFGSVFLFMGWLDLFHTFSFKGMSDFFIANTSSNRATTLFVISRLFGTLGLMISISIPNKVVSNIKKETFIMLTTIFSILILIIVTYIPGFFPPMYIEEEGLTWIKIFLEYIVIFILALTFIFTEREYRKTKSDREFQFMLALLLLMFSEFAFTNYGSIHDAFNYIGHLYKVIAFSLLYKTIYIENVSIPFREMKKAKNKLRQYSDNLNITIQERTKELVELNEVLLSDIEYAKEMQRCLLPAQMPKNMSVSFDAVYLPAEKLSGDFYNVVKLDENNIAIYIGDVSGHGISAAMLTVFAYQNIIQLKEKIKCDEEIIKPEVILKTIYNSFNKTNFAEEQYIVMLYGIYNIKDRTFNYSSAGINVQPYIIKKSGVVHEIDSKGFPICKLGDFIKPTYENRTIQLEIGDKILFYSDGLVDAKNSEEEIYGEKRLKDCLKHNRHLNSKDLNSSIKSDLFNHIGFKNLLMDDVTFLTMDILE